MVKRTQRVALLWSAIVVIGVGGLVLMLTNPAGLEDSFTPHSLISLGFASVGALIILRRPHRVGTLFLAFGTLTAVTGFLFQACPDASGDTAGLGALCGDDGRIGMLLWPAGYLFLGGLFLLFPTGSLPSTRWRPVAAAFVATWTGLGVLSFLFGDRWVEQHAGYLNVTAVYLLVAAAASPLFRMRKASAVERQQLRWVGFVIVVTFVLIGVGIALDLAGRQVLLNVVTGLIFANAVVGIPVAITIAILRYRLYDIDLIVNRTLVYVLLTAALAGAYLGSVVILQRVLAPITADSDLAVAGSTLAVAALFRPLRSRVQSFIDQRFYRRKYDAAETLASFSSQLRDQVDLAALSGELVSVVAATMQPSHTSLWLRSHGLRG